MGWYLQHERNTIMSVQDQASTPSAGPFWFFDREARELVRWDGRAAIYLPNCDNTADLLGRLLSISPPDSPMPAGAFEDLLLALREIFGEDVMYELEISGEGTIVDIPNALGVDDLDAYLETVKVPPARLGTR